MADRDSVGVHYELVCETCAEDTHVGEAADADYMQAASGPGGGAAAAQPAARDAVGVPASRTATTGGALAS
eukprot:7090712-Prymnesium_polylepis.1